MNTSNKKTIRLSAAMATLSLRSNADMLWDAIEKAKETEIVADFKGVELMSRSFAQQYVMRKKKTRKRVTEVHIAEDIKKMFDMVKRKKTRHIIFNAEDFDVVTVPQASSS